MVAQTKNIMHIVFNFSWDLQSSQEKLKTMRTQKLGINEVR